MEGKAQGVSPQCRTSILPVPRVHTAATIYRDGQDARPTLRMAAISSVIQIPRRLFQRDIYSFAAVNSRFSGVLRLRVRFGAASSDFLEPSDKLRYMLTNNSPIP